MIQPTFEALRLLGGSGSNDEINERVAELLSLSDDVRDLPHGDTSVSEVNYRLAWSRTYLKKAGYIENSKRGIWSLTELGNHTAAVDPREIVASVRAGQSRRNGQPLEPGLEITPSEVADSPDPELSPAWEERYLESLISLQPAAFERLVMRMLRESGFTKVDVTGRSGDEGIDGIGIVRINGFLSFRVLFQCKRYNGSVGPGDIRDFRGAMQGRTDKGLFVTTGTFTTRAIAEANRDGAPPIDLLDGPDLVQRLKELGLGVQVKVHQVETVEMDTHWLDSI